MKNFDVMVLGAGMVGIATALHLLERDRSVALVDRRGPAEETSFGNAGLIQAEAVMPYAFPRRIAMILGVLSGRRTDARVAWRALGTTATWLLAYAGQSHPAAVMRTAKANAPLVAEAVAAHRALADPADAAHLFHADGYLRLYRDAKALDGAAEADAVVKERFGIPFAVWDQHALGEAEPHLSKAIVGAVHLPQPVRVDDPGGLGKAYAALFEARGGVIVRGDALGLTHDQGGGGFAVDGEGGSWRAREAVVCLGPWSGDFPCAGSALPFHSG